MLSSVRTIAVSGALIAGLLLGLGLFTFQYAEGLSYFSTDPAACANCHIMNEQYDSWQKSSHHTVAKCIDCHLPHAFIAKYLAKAENGYFHSKGFTLQDFHEPIMLDGLSCTAGDRANPRRVDRLRAPRTSALPSGTPTS